MWYVVNPAPFIRPHFFSPINLQYGPLSMIKAEISNKLVWGAKIFKREFEETMP